MSEKVQLDDPSIEILADLNAQTRALNAAREAILMRFVRANKLNPQEWILSEDQRELVKRNGTPARPEVVGE